VKQRDHWTRRLAHDLADQIESMLRARPEPDERKIGLFSRGNDANLSDEDLARDHLVSETGDDLGQELEPVAPLVGDEDTEVRGFGWWIHPC
jgi:hypothetical protein